MSDVSSLIQVGDVCVILSCVCDAGGESFVVGDVEEGDILAWLGDAEGVELICVCVWVFESENVFFICVCVYIYTCIHGVLSLVAQSSTIMRENINYHYTVSTCAVSETGRVALSHVYFLLHMYVCMWACYCSWCSHRQKSKKT